MLSRFGAQGRLGLILVTFVALAGLWPAAAARGQLESGDQLSTKIAQAVELLESAHRDLARQPFDADGIIEQVGRDPAKLSQWVASHISFEPYRGFLKGPEGTLVSCRGNSADKALLLATLLGKAGFQSQLVHSNSAGVALKASSQPRIADSPDQKQLDALAKRLGIASDRVRQMTQSAQMARNDLQERLWNRTARDLDTIAQILESAHIPVPHGAPAQMPSDRWWVRTSDGDFDPTFDGAPPKDGQVFELTKLPDSEFHRISLQVMIRKDKEPASVLKTSFRAADLFGQTLTVANLPLDAADKISKLRSPTAQSILDVLAGSTKFQPQLIVSTSDGAGKLISGKGFDLKGNQISVSHGRAAQAQQLGGGIGGLFGGGGGGGDAGGNSKLTGCWLEIELTAPGDPSPLNLKRNLISDEPGISNRQRILNLLAVREVLLLPEEISDDYATSRVLFNVQQWGKYLAAHGKKEMGQMSAKTLIGQPQFNQTLYAFGVARRGALQHLCDGRYGATGYAHVRPTAVCTVSRFIDGKSPAVSRGIDILENTLEPVSKANQANATTWRQQFALACGVLDTALEHEINGGGDEHLNASVSLESALLAGANPIAIASNIPADLKLSNEARAEIQAQLAGSAFVMLPHADGWYRVRLNDGATLGYMSGAGGSEEAEYAEMAEVLSQLREIINFYADMGRCLGAAISNPLAGQTDPHENLKECFQAMCAMIPLSTQWMTGVEADWTNVIICNSVSQMWDGVCEKLWDSVGGGEGGGGGGGGE